MFFGGDGKDDTDLTDSTDRQTEWRTLFFLNRIASPDPRITESPDSDSGTNNPWIALEERTIPVERTTLEELKARTPETRIPETPALGAVPANLQFARGPAQVDLSAGPQMGSQAAAAVLPGNDTWAAAAVLTGDADTDEDFAFIVTNRLSLQHALQQGDALKWLLAIDSKVASLQHYLAFRQVDTNYSGKVIPTKIILAEKQNDRGKVERYKARLVVQTFFQRSGFDFDAEATYKPTVDVTVLRLLLAKAASADLAIWQYDVKTTYF